MYPSKKNVRYGIFVKNFEEAIKDSYNLHKVVLTKKYSLISKLVGYTVLYLKTAKLLFKRTDSIIYVHYPLYLAPVLLLISIIKKNMVLNFHGTDLIFDNKFSKLLGVFQKPLVKRCRIVVPSNYYKEKVIETYKCKEEKIFVYPSGGINTDVFYPQNTAKQKKFTIGFISNFIKEKGWLEFLEAMLQVQNRGLIENLNIIMVGDGPDENKIKSFVLKHKLPVLFFSKLTQPQLATKYNTLNLFIFPTHSESLGLVGLEAMACGVPVIASKVGGPMGYVEDGKNGYLFNIKDVEMLVEKTVGFYSLSKEEKKIINNHALITSQYYDANLVQKELLGFLQ